MFSLLNTTTPSKQNLNIQQTNISDPSNATTFVSDPSNATTFVSDIPISSYTVNLPLIELSQPPINESFIYLQDKLNRLFGFCMKTQNKKYNVYLCFYSINETCVINYTPTPFLQFLLCKTSLDQKWSFPSFEYDCPIINDTQDETENENENIPPPEQTHFENECFKHVLELLHTNINFHMNDNNNIIKDMYQGFIEYDDSNLVVVYNFTNNTNLFLPTATNTQNSPKEVQITYIWKILDEMIYKNQPDYNDMIISFFQKFDYIKHIKTLDGDIIPYPFALYLCAYDENNNINNVLTEQYLITSLEQSHPFFNNGVYFSTNPIHSEDNIKLKKYAVFIDNCLYILKDITEIDNEIKVSYTNNIISSSAFYFHENNLQLWGVKDILRFVEI